MILREVKRRELLSDEQFRFVSKFSTSLQVAHIIERVTGNYCEKRLAYALFLFDTLWVDGLLYMLTLLNPLVR
jgi:hypothetical protein